MTGIPATLAVTTAAAVTLVMPEVCAGMLYGGDCLAFVGVRPRPQSCYRHTEGASKHTPDCMATIGTYASPLMGSEPKKDRLASSAHASVRLGGISQPGA
jgi:hypothetical protein